MKTIITINLDTELIKKLKAEKNYSQLINDQMKGYYDVKLIDNLEDLNEKLAENKQKTKILRKKRRVLDETIDKILKKQKLFKKKLLPKNQMIAEIRRRRDIRSLDKYRTIKYFTTAEEEADRLMKGGAK